MSGSHYLQSHRRITAENNPQLNFKSQKVWDVFIVDMLSE